MYGTLQMGETAERVAQKYEVSREDQDAFAVRSHQRAIAAQKSGRLELSAVTAHGGARRGHDHCFRHVPTSWQRAWRESSARPRQTPGWRPAPPAGTTRTPSPPRRST